MGNVQKDGNGLWIGEDKGINGKIIKIFSQHQYKVATTSNIIAVLPTISGVDSIGILEIYE